MSTRPQQAQSTYATRPIAASRPFLIAPYEPDPSGVFRPQIPDCCICHDVDGPPCWITVDHWRPRKTGPCFPLLVARCSVHDCTFTVYPPGHYPWGRGALVPVAPNGHAIIDADLRDTVFEAALDAADRTAWKRPVPPWSDQQPDPTQAAAGWWSTQCRQLGFSLRLLGLDDDLDDDQRHRICGVLHVETLFAKDAVAAIATSPGYRSRGEAICKLLDRVVHGVLRRLLIAGHYAGLWGRPLWWDGVLRPLVFSSSGTDPPSCQPAC